MQKRTTMLAALLAAALVLGGCAQQGGPTQEQTGAVVGGALGGILGSQVGGGTGQTAAIIGGTLAGSAIGASIGETMDEVDRQRMGQTLETQPDHQSSEWQNPNTGHEYQVTPTETRDAGGQPCRTFETEAVIDGQRETVTGEACRTADGQWEMH